MTKYKYTEIERWILIYANRARKKELLKPLRSNFGLRKVARFHSKEMAKTGKIWHGDGVYKAKQSLTFSSFWEHIISLFLNTGISGENVGMMPLGKVIGFKHEIRTNKDIAKAQHISWMKSSGHRDNILNYKFSKIGVGVKKKRKSLLLHTIVLWLMQRIK